MDKEEKVDIEKNNVINLKQNMTKKELKKIKKQEYKHIMLTG